MKEYTLEIKNCGFADCSPEWRWDINGCKGYDLWAVFRGEGEIQVGNGRFDVTEGWCFLLPPAQPIHGRHNPKNPLFVIYIHIDFFNDNSPIYPYGVEKRFVVNIPFFKELLYRVVSAHYRDANTEASAWLKVALHEFFNSPNMREKDKTENMHIRYVQDICKQINENVASSTCLADFAYQYGYSATYLGKIFHQITGITFSQYLSNARINQAKTLLLNGDTSITQISERLGYYDSCHFIREFKKIVGCPPNAYR